MICQTADWRQQRTPFTLLGDTSSIPIDPVKTNVMLLPRSIFYIRQHWFKNDESPLALLNTNQIILVNECAVKKVETTIFQYENVLVKQTFLNNLNLIVIQITKFKEITVFSKI